MNKIRTHDSRIVFKKTLSDLRYFFWRRVYSKPDCKEVFNNVLTDALQNKRILQFRRKDDDYLLFLHMVGIACNRMRVIQHPGNEITPALLKKPCIDNMLARHESIYGELLTKRLFSLLNTSHIFTTYGLRYNN